MNLQWRSVGSLGIVAVVLIVGIGMGLGGPTLTTITLDGSMADWATVLANPVNVVNDGPGGSLPDADSPSVARVDMDKVAFTWDATYLYFYIHRQGTAGEFNYFWIEFDLNNDGYVANNAPMLSVAWWGSNQKVTTTLDTYKAANVATGDKITSAAGKHDGYKLPGTLAAGVSIETLNSGSPSGLEVETRVSWASLGVAPGSAFQFHVSSGRRSGDYPGAIADNTGMGAAFAGVDFSPDRSATTLPGSQFVLAHNIRNIGGVTDTFDLTWTSTGGFAPSLVNFYLDADSSGTLTPGDTLLGDTNGNGLSDTGSMAGGSGPRAILAIAQIPFSAVKGQVSTITLKANSSVDAGVSDTAMDTITINQPTITLLKSVDKATAPPGGVLTYSIVYTNTGNADAVSVEVIDPVPSASSYVAGSAAGVGMTIQYSHDGGSTYDVSQTSPVTHVRWQRAAALAPGNSGTVTVKVAVN
ncbi:MAG TPA: DUF11 domain-containing protein [Patescibacteria group bacterium]|nr:DUF11 domain-containing protein [Patescibacteria group bacterium]